MRDSRIRRWLLCAGMALWLACFASWAAHASEPEVTLTDIHVERNIDGLFLSFSARFELPPAVQDALYKGLPLNFVAQAQVTRERWYWTDRRVAQSSRGWRLAYQPLTRRYRVTFGGLSQEYDNLPMALAALQRTLRWQVASAQDLGDGPVHRINLSFRLNTAALPRPFQIGITGNTDWTLEAETSIALDGRP